MKKGSFPNFGPKNFFSKSFPKFNWVLGGFFVNFFVFYPGSFFKFLGWKIEIPLFNHNYSEINLTFAIFAMSELKALRWPLFNL